MARANTRTLNKIMSKAVKLTAILFLIQIIGINRVYTQANPYDDYRPMREGEIGFEELQEINPDVFGWLSIYGTNIDYPLLQNDDNQRYLHTNARGEPAMSGAIFLDFRNSQDFTDFNNIIYGHDMARAAMFGEIGNFAQEDVFEAHRYGMLFTGENFYGIELFAFLLVDAHDFEIYNPNMVDIDDKEAFIERLLTDAIRSRSIEISIDDRLVMLSTCTPTATNGRHILMGRLTDVIPDDGFGSDQPRGIIGFFAEMGQFGLAMGLLLVITAIVSITLLVMLIIKKRKKSVVDLEKDDGELVVLKKKRKQPTFFGESLLLLSKLAMIMLALSLLFIFVLGATQVSDSSMAPTMQEGDIVFFQRIGRDFVVNDEIVVRYDSQIQVRRIVAVAGDEVDITDDGLVINGVPQQEFHIFEETTQFVEGITFPLIVPEKEVFVLGDSRTRARDSRIYGTIRIDDTLGSVVTVIRRRNL